MPLSDEEPQVIVSTNESVAADIEPARADTAFMLPSAIPLDRQRDESMDNQNPDEIILANPQWGSVAMLAAAASFDTVVPGAMASAYSNMFRAIERNGLFSLSNGGGSLETTFQQMFGIVDEDGKKKDADGDGWDDYLESQQERAEIRRQMEGVRWKRWVQPVIATAWANFSAGVWYIKVFLGRSLSCLAMVLS